MLTECQIESAVEYNNSKNYSSDCWKLIQYKAGTQADGQPGKNTANAIASFQNAAGLKEDGKAGPSTLSFMSVEVEYVTYLSAVFEPFTDAAADRLVKLTADMESGGNYGACNRDGEYEGKFDKKGKTHRASKYGDTPIHIGLSWGYIQFTQDGGTLGRVLSIAHKRDPEAFNAVFGNDAETMLAIVTKKGKSGLQTSTLRGTRVQKVGGVDLWKDPWVSRFKKAAELELFQWAQRMVAMEDYMSPAFKHAVKMNLNSERGLVVLFDRTVQLGAGGMRSLLARAGVGSTNDFDDPVMDIRHQLDKLHRYTTKYNWHHRVAKIMGDINLRDHIIFTL